jgi:hypothetical protein
MSIKFIRLAHDLGLGCGDPRDIEIVGDRGGGARTGTSPARSEDDLRVADAAQDLLGPLKKPIEWSLKTVLAPWAYIASVVYHDSFWYPVLARKKMHDVLAGVGTAVQELGTRHA